MRLLKKKVILSRKLQMRMDFPLEDIASVAKWVKSTIDRLIRDPKKKLVACNWCAYGASFVHLDKGGHVLTPLYNYLKPYPEELQEKLYDQYEGRDGVCTQNSVATAG